MDNRYERFLNTSDLETWTECLEAYSRSASSGSISDDDLYRGICVSLYVQWLSHISGKLASAEAHKTESERLIEILDKRHRDNPNSTTRRSWAVVLAWRNLKIFSRQLLCDEESVTKSDQFVDPGLPANIDTATATLMTSGDPAKQAAVLRRFISGDTPPFAPTFWSYCAALIQLGAIHEVDDLITNSGLAADNPLLIDLRGQIHERLGRWQQALDSYRQSTWPGHRYRAALCAIVADAGSMDKLVVDEALVQSFSQYETEIDQGEVARTMAFVNACTWKKFDDWIVQFEIGKLNFRRRRHVEADQHLKLALSMAPNPLKASIANLRHGNLSWLSSGSVLTEWLGLTMKPEAMERAAEALSFTSEDGLPGVRVWLASMAKESRYLPSSMQSWDPYNAGLAHQFLGNRPEAIACSLHCLDTDYTHRSILPLIAEFRSARFEAAADYLVGLVTKESWNDFFSIWELSRDLLTSASRYSETSEEYSLLMRRIESVAGRMIELAHLDFQHLVRAHDFFSSAGQVDIAETLLRRAVALAENPAECLAVATAQRQSAWFDPVDTDPEVLALLDKAERQSRTRLERLQIAREYFHYGQVEHARRILEEEGVFSVNQRLDPYEYIVSLECGKWLKSEEFVALADRALNALTHDLTTGIIKRYGNLYSRRLFNTILLTDISVSRRLQRRWETPVTEDNEWDESHPELLAGTWKRWKEEMLRLRETKDFDRERQSFLNQVNELKTTGAFEQVLATWSWVQDQVNEALDAAVTARPDSADNSVPISRSLTLEDDARLLELSDLWRRYLATADEDVRSTAQQGIHSFYAIERDRENRWLAQQRQKSQEPLRRAQFFTREGSALLRRLEAPPRVTSNQVIQDLWRAIQEDCRRLQGYTRELSLAIESELSLMN